MAVIKNLNEKVTGLMREYNEVFSVNTTPNLARYSPPSYRVVLFHCEALQSLQRAGLPAFLHLLHASLPLQEQLHNRVGGVNLVIFRSHKRLQLRRKRLGFCGITLFSHHPQSQLFSLKYILGHKKPPLLHIF